MTSASESMVISSRGLAAEVHAAREATHHALQVWTHCKRVQELLETQLRKGEGNVKGASPVSVAMGGGTWCLSRSRSRSPPPRPKEDSLRSENQPPLLIAEVMRVVREGSSDPQGEGMWLWAVNTDGDFDTFRSSGGGSKKLLHKAILQTQNWQRWLILNEVEAANGPEIAVMLK